MKKAETKKQSKEETARLRLHAQTAQFEASLSAGLKAGREFVFGMDERTHCQLVALDRHQEHNDPPDNLASLTAAMDPTDGSLPERFREKYGRKTEEWVWVIGFVLGARLTLHVLASRK